MMLRALELSTRYQIPILLLATVASVGLWPEGAAGVLIGGILMGANFWLIRFLLGKVFLSEQPKTGYVIMLGGKFVAVMGAIPLLMWAFDLHPLGFALGLMTVFVGIGCAVVHVQLSPKQSELTGA
jgi:hypothetical protein